MKIAILFFFITLNLSFAAEHYKAPDLSLKTVDQYAKPIIKKEQWEVQRKIESPINRKIASERKEGRKPSSTKPLFQPWIYKAIP